MINEILQCAYEECKKDFVKTTHNQKYCSDFCCRTATNLKIKERYYENKARLKGAKRTCQTPKCNTKLSRYNESRICNKCLALQNGKDKNELIRMVQSVSSETGKA
jgi:hypothetical protein